MAMPSQKELKKILKKLDKAPGTLMIAPNATPLERFRWDLCQQFIKYKRDSGVTQDELAEALGVDKAKVSKILHHRIKEFSTDRLISLYQRLHPGLKIKMR